MEAILTALVIPFLALILWLLNKDIIEFNDIKKSISRSTYKDGTTISFEINEIPKLSFDEFLKYYNNKNCLIEKYDGDAVIVPCFTYQHRYYPVFFKTPGDYKKYRRWAKKHIEEMHACKSEEALKDLEDMLNKYA